MCVSVCECVSVCTCLVVCVCVCVSVCEYVHDGVVLCESPLNEIRLKA